MTTFTPGVRRIGPLVFCLALLGTASPIALQDKSLTARVDELLAEEWKKQKISPVPAAEDAEFLRRITLDLTGTIPTLEEAVKFLNDRDLKKREKKIDDLLDSAAYADYWSSYWNKLLVLPTTSAATREALGAWLRKSFEQNTPFDRMVTDLIAGSGNPDTPGPAAFVGQLYRSGNNPNAVMPALTNRIGRAFMGIQLTCSQCHNDPYREWTQMDFWGTTAFLARVRQTQNGVEDVPHGELSTPDELKKPVKIKANEEPEVYSSRFVPLRFVKDDEKVGKGSRRAVLADWITSPKNPYFARSVTNRMWGMLLGRGIVDSVDDFHSKNAPSHPQLLDTLAEEFVTMRYDMKALLRSIALTKAYQLSSQKGGRGAEADQLTHFARARLRSMSSEQLVNTFVRATSYDDIVRQELQPQTGKMTDAGMEIERAFSTRMFQIRREFEKYFGSEDDPGNPHAAQQNALQASLFLKSPYVQTATTATSGGMLSKILDSFRSSEDRVKAMYLTVLSRYPSSSEAAMALQAVSTKPKDRCEDLFWALLNASEFLFIH